MAQVRGGQSDREVGSFSVRQVRSWLAAQALPALTVVLGLQMLRIFIPTLYDYLGEARGVSTMNLGAVAIVTFALAFLAAVVHRLLGPRLALVYTAGGLAILRLLAQFITVPSVDLVLGGAGVVLFLWFLPVYLGRVRGGGPQATTGFGQAILLGLCLDAASQGAAGAYDLVWQAGAAPALVVLLLSGLQLYTVYRAGQEAPAGASDGPLLPTLALIGLSPFLALQAMLLQSPAAWAALTGWSLPLTLGCLLFSYAAAMAIASWVAPRLARNAWHWLVLGSLALVAMMALPLRGIAAAAELLACQALAAIGLLSMFRLLGQRAGKAGLWRTTVAHGSGSLLFVIGAFLYFASYWIHLPLESTAVLPGLAALLGLIASAAVLGLRSDAPRLDRAVWLVPASLPALLLIVPLALGIVWRQPAAATHRWPVRVMSYNLHHGFNVAGRLDLEALAQNIEKAGADVVGLEEVTRGWYLDGSPDIASWLSQRLGMPYRYTEAVDPYFGNVILSRLPIKEWGRASLPRTAWEMRRSYIWARLDVGGEDLLFVALHTHHVEGEGAIRLPQMAEVAKFWDQKSRTVIVGDMNASPEDPEIALFAKAGLLDAFVLAGSGDGFTWKSDRPYQRIDYVWLSPDLKASDFVVGQGTASDHLPVAVTVRP